MKWIVGLGNPGRRYENTPHNVGFEVVDELAWRGGMTWSASRQSEAEVCKGRIAGVECALVKPTTFMNLSGDALLPLFRGREMDLGADFLVVYDEAALPLGQLRLRTRGSSAGHKGIQSVIDRLRTQDFPRLRCGVGPTGEDDPAKAVLDHNRVAFVLSKWPKSRRPDIDALKARAADAVEMWLTEGVEKVMNTVNRRNENPE
jgi:PTH1 family peptidyl-tRNA hydrolase